MVYVVCTPRGKLETVWWDLTTFPIGLVWINFVTQNYDQTKLNKIHSLVARDYALNKITFTRLSYNSANFLIPCENKFDFVCLEANLFILIF